MNCPNCGYNLPLDPTKKIVVTQLVQTCGGCPSQWDGETDDGRYVYIRYRWGTLSIDVSHVNILSLNHGSNMDGVMSEDELKQLTKDSIEWQV